jgi:hypothetical protein
MQRLERSSVASTSSINFVDVAFVASTLSLLLSLLLRKSYINKVDAFVKVDVAFVASTLLMLVSHRLLLSLLRSKS